MKVYLLYEYDYLTEKEYLLGIFDTEEKASELVDMYKFDNQREGRPSLWSYNIVQEVVQ